MAFPRPPVKKTLKVAQAHRTGELRAERIFRSKTFKNKSQLQNWIYERLEKFLDRIDPLEAFAVVGTTYLIKTGMDWAQLALHPIDVNVVYKLLTAQWTEVFKEIQEGIKEGPPKEPLDVAVTEWVISFIIAFVIVRHGEALIEAGGNLLGVAKGLLGGLA